VSACVWSLLHFCFEIFLDWGFLDCLVLMCVSTVLRHYDDLFTVVLVLILFRPIPF
jgi:hypothetical protein